MLKELKAISRELLKTKRVDVILAYKRASDGVSAAPYFIFEESDIDGMVLDSYCVYNLSGYIKDFPGKKIGLAAKACDIKSIIVLLQENQLKREDVVIMGVECHGVIDEKRLCLTERPVNDIGFNEKCRSCKSSLPAFCDYLLKDEEGKRKTLKTEEGDEYASIRKMEAKSPAERLKFWEEEFSRCIRCYACRQVCPLCYCPKCVADQTDPAWFSKASNLTGNMSWNVVRAIHLAGRCIGCGECERACPVGIPLMELNKKIEKDVKELFGYEAGADAKQKPLFTCFDKNDPEDFIK